MTLTARAHFLPDAKLERHWGTHPVGSYSPNALSLYDAVVGGGWYDANAYRNAKVRNPWAKPKAVCGWFEADRR